MADKLRAGLALLGFVDDTLDTLERQMNTYIDELLLFNKMRRMVNTDDRDEIVVRHILDSLAGYAFIAKHCKAGDVIADVGSGAGFPGIPLSCAMNDCHFLLIERMTTRAAFLHNVTAVMHLDNVEVLHQEAQNIKGTADVITCRAYSPLNKASLATYKSILKSGGLVALYKTPNDAIQAEGTKGFAVTPIIVPFMEDRSRCIVSFTFD